MTDLTKGAPVYSEADSDDLLLNKLVDGTDPLGVDKQCQVSEKELHTKARTMDGNGNANSAANPIYVNEVSSGQTVEQSEDEAVDVAKNASADHDFSPAAESRAKEIICSASGSAKFEVLIGVALSEVKRFTLFVGDQGGTVEKKFDYAESVLATENVKVTKTNLAPAQSLYSTIVLENV